MRDGPRERRSVGLDGYVGSEREGVVVCLGLDHDRYQWTR